MSFYSDYCHHDFYSTSNAEERSSPRNTIIHTRHQP
jgi:hypothetical protein